MSETDKPPGQWSSLPFQNAVKRLKSNGGKIPAGKYKTSGTLPIIDQGQTLVVGYTDDIAAGFQGPLPVIIFGDHTRNVKYVDFNFAVGADGTIILRPIDQIDPKFFSYWLQSLPLHDLGYSRHYKLLSEQEVRYPPLPEQWRIVARVDAVASRIHELVNHTRAIADAVDRTLTAFYERIIDGAVSSPFGEVARLVRRAIKSIPDGRYAEMGIRSFGKGTFPKPVVTGSQLGNKRVYRVCAGDLVFMNVFAWEGAIAVAQADDDGRVGSHRFLTHEVNTDLATAEFLCFHFLTPQGLETIDAASPGSAGRNRTLGIEKLAQIHVPVPAIEDQRRFARMIRLQHELKQLQGRVESGLKAITPALLAKAFRGQL